jgi:hypothetical protein
MQRCTKSPDYVSDGLKALGSLGMKVTEHYGGLGLSQVYYNRALALTASSHAAISTLLSAHQSIGVAEPLMLFGSEEQKRKWLPLVAKYHISAFLLTEHVGRPRGWERPRRRPPTAGMSSMDWKSATMVQSPTSSHHGPGPSRRFRGGITALVPL